MFVAKAKDNCIIKYRQYTKEKKEKLQHSIKVLSLRAIFIVNIQKHNIKNRKKKKIPALKKKERRIKNITIAITTK